MNILYGKEMDHFLKPSISTDPQKITMNNIIENDLYVFLFKAFLF